MNWDPAKAAMPSELDRRGEIRERRNDELAVLVDAAGEGESREVKAWAYNGSEAGLCFRCREELPKRVRVQLSSGNPAEVCIVRHEEVAPGIWEYGGFFPAVGKPKGNGRVPCELTEEELRELTLCAFVGKKPSSESREQIESMRAVANHNARSAIRLHQATRRLRRARLTAALSLSAYGLAIASLLGFLPWRLHFFIAGIGAISAIEWFRAVAHKHRQTVLAQRDSFES